MKTNKLLLLSLIPVLVSCNAPTSSDESKTITDMQGREVTYKTSDTSRIVCLGAGALRFYSYIGDVSKLVAVEEIDKAPFGIGTAIRPYYHANKDYFATLPTCGKGGPAAQKPDTEAIAAVAPKMIISFYSDAGVNNDLSSTLGVPVIALKQGGQGIYDDVTMSSLELLGKVLNKESRFNALKDYIDTSKTELAKLTVKENETYYAGCIGNWGSTDFYGSMRNFPVFNQARVKNGVDEIINADAQVKIDPEKIVEMNPDKIFLDGAGTSGFIAGYKADPTVYNSLDAFKNNEIYMLMPYNAYYTNLEIQMISTYYVASIAHPESFEGFDIVSKANEILNKFVGKACYNELLNYSTAFGGYSKVNLKELIGE